MASRAQPFAVANWAALALLCALFVPTAAHAANNCPWLNEATASDLLDAESVGTFTPAAPDGAGVCAFTERDSRTPRTLQINVEIVSDAHARVLSLSASCGSSSSPLTAIGNEAVICATDERKGRETQRVIGRVRDQVFTITLSASGKEDSVQSREALKAHIYTAAEQVAGNLF